MGGSTYKTVQDFQGKALGGKPTSFNDSGSVSAWVPFFKPIPNGQMLCRMTSSLPIYFGIMSYKCLLPIVLGPLFENSRLETGKQA